MRSGTAYCYDKNDNELDHRHYTGLSRRFEIIDWWKNDFQEMAYIQMFPDTNDLMIKADGANINGCVPKPLPIPILRSGKVFLRPKAEYHSNYDNFKEQP